MLAYGKFQSVFMVHGDLLVDTFFVVSGLVFTYNILKFFEKNKRFNITMGIIDRYVSFLTMPRSHDVMSYIYVKSHNRAGAFIMGILCACILYNYNKTEKENKLSTIKATLGAFLGIFIMFGALVSGYVFYDPSRIYNALEAAIYAGFIRVIWSLGLCLVILCTTFGEVPIVKAFLCWNPFAKLSKLVYGMYLIHMLFQIREVGLSRQPLLLDPLSIFVKALGDMALSTVLSFFTYTLIESPIRDMVKLAVNGGKNKRQEPTDPGTSASASVDKLDSSSSTMALHNLSKNMVINNINISRETLQQKM